MDYYNEIKEKLIDSEIYGRVKDYSKERYKVIIYFEIGKLLTEVGKKYNRRTLFRMKKFYKVFKNEKVTTLLTQLTWSHYLLLLSITDYDEIIYYINVSRNNNLTQRQLLERIRSNEYQRLPIESRNKLIKNENLKPNLMI